MSGSLPTWLQRFLGVESPTSGEGTLWSFDNTWRWAPWATLLFAMLVVAWVGYFYAREGSVAGRRTKGLLICIRLALIAIVAIMIAEYTLSLRRTGLPTVVIMVDDSQSMSLVDNYDDKKLQAALVKRIAAAGLDLPSRLNLAKTVVSPRGTDLLSEIEKNYRLQVYTVSSTARVQPGTPQQLRDELAALQPVGQSSRLGAGVRQVLSELRGTPPAAIILLTDGINTDGESLADAARAARRKNVAIFAVGIGSPDAPRDLDLSDLLVDEVVFVDDVVNFQFKLTGTGYAGRTVEVTLHEADSSTPLAQMKVEVALDGRPQRLQLPFRPTKVGDFQFVVEVEHLSDETQAENNRQQRLVSVRKEQIAVLLVQAYPNYEFRYLKNMLERDSTIKLKTVLQDADLEYTEQDQTALRAFPVRSDELFAFDVVIFGDVNPAYLSGTAMQTLHDFVEKKGGGVAFIAGPKYTPYGYRNTPLESLFPVDLTGLAAPLAGESAEQGYVPRLTDMGLASPIMQLGDNPAETARVWRDLPPMYWLLEAPQLKPAARVLAEHPSRLSADGRPLPVFVLQYVGAGKVLFHATDDTWRWRYRVGDVFFARYWVQAVRHLSRSKLLGKDHAVELATDRREYRRGDVVQVRARFIDERQAPAEDDGVSVVLEREGQRIQHLSLHRNAANRGVFEGTFEGAVDGRYHLWIAAPTLEGNAPSADFLVVAPPGESERVQMDAGELKRAAEETRGRFYPINEVDRLVDDLPPGHQVPLETLPALPLWNQWWLLLTFLALIISEWLIRKRKGMV